MNVPGVLWIQTATRGRGYMVDVDRKDNFQKYLMRKTRFLGDDKSGSKIVDTSFSIKRGALYFGWRKVRLHQYSHAVFNFAVGTLTESLHRKLLEIRSFLVEHNIEVINDPSNIGFATDKIRFFEMMQNKGFRVPDWKMVEAAEELPEWHYPYLLRTNNDTGGKNCHKVNSDTERDLVWAELSRERASSNRYELPRIMAVKYIDPFDERFGVNIKYRVCLIKDHVFIYYGLPSDDWKIQALKVTKDGHLFTEVNLHANQLIEASRTMIVAARHAVGLECIAFDFLVEDDQIVFLEAMPKFGIPNHEDGATFAELECTEKSTVFNAYHNDPEGRNRRAYEMLFRKQGVADESVVAG